LYIMVFCFGDISMVFRVGVIGVGGHVFSHQSCMYPSVQ
jgi:hypothetical protein